LTLVEAALTRILVVVDDDAVGNPERRPRS